MKPVVFTERAKKRLIETSLYIFEKTKSAEKADEFLDEMQRYIVSQLNAFPRIGREAPEFGAGVRKLVYRRYTILYIIEKNRYVVITLFRENLP